MVVVVVDGTVVDAVVVEIGSVDEVVSGTVDGDGASTVVDTGTLVDGSVSIGAASVSAGGTDGSSDTLRSSICVPYQPAQNPLSIPANEIHTT